MTATPALRNTAVASLFALAGLPPAVHAAPAGQVEFAIPAGSLSSALLQLAETSGEKVLFNADLVRGRASHRVEGRMSAEQALQKLLAGSDLEYRHTSTGSLTIAARTAPATAEPAAKPSLAPAAPQTVVLPSVTVSAKPDDDANAPYSKNYAPPNAFSATKTDTPIMETPVSIQVVPRSVLNDQKSVSIKDALENVSSVRPQPSIGVFNGFIVRGFPDFNQYRNGLRVTYTDFDTANLERLEVLKGPAAILFGRVEPGGLINLVTKQPQATPYYSLEQQFGAFDFYRTLYDATGPLTANGDVQYRLTGDYQNSGSFRQYHQTEQYQIHAALNWRVTDATQLGFDIEGFNKDFQSDQGLPAIGNRPAPIPIRRSLQDPNDPQDHLSTINIGFNLTHKFNEDWVLRNRFLAQLGRWDLFDTVVAYFDASALQADNRTLDRTLFYQAADRENYATNLDLTGNFDFGGAHHKTLIGFDYLRANETYTAFGDFATADPTLAIDIFNPTTRIDPARFNLNAIKQGFGTFVGSYQKAEEEW